MPCHVLDEKSRLCIAVNGRDSSSISRNQNGHSTTPMETRIRAIVLADSSLVTQHIRIVGTRAQNGFQNLNLGESWKIGSCGTRHVGVETEFRALLDVAKRLLGMPFKTIDPVSIRLAPEIAENDLPAQRIVFPACRPFAFNADGTRCPDTPAGTGMRKPGEYWNALRPSREKYVNNAACQSIGNGEGKVLKAEAGDAVKRLGWPILIAVRIGGTNRFFHLFSDFVDYLCYYDLRAWQDHAPNPYKYPELIQA